MKHVGKDAMRALEPLLEQIRLMDGLREKKNASFYRNSSAFIHFHEDPAGLFADVKIKNKWKRFPVNTRNEQSTFFARVKSSSVFF